MKRQHIYLPFAVLAAALASGCNTPHKDVPMLTSEIDAVEGGFYGQSIHHEELAEENLKQARKVLRHWQNDEYWNIDEGRQGVDAARAASQHRLESEKALCSWLTAVHSPNHHPSEVAQHVAAYFKTGSAVPYKTNKQEIAALGNYLQAHPDASADVTAYTDTVGSKENNLRLAERRASTVGKMLEDQGAKPEQLRIVSEGEAIGPDNTPNQENRVVMMSTLHPSYQDCAGLQ